MGRNPCRRADANSNYLQHRADCAVASPSAGTDDAGLADHRRHASKSSISISFTALRAFLVIDLVPVQARPQNWPFLKPPQSDGGPRVGTSTRTSVRLTPTGGRSPHLEQRGCSHAAADTHRDHTIPSPATPTFQKQVP